MFLCMSTEVSDIIGLKAQDPLKISLILEHAFMHTELPFQKIMLLSIHPILQATSTTLNISIIHFIICGKLFIAKSTLFAQSFNIAPLPLKVH